jgi:transcriptional regulator with XRE-family HTH domain
MPARPQDAAAAEATAKTLAQALRSRRFARALTQAALAERLGISLEAYSRLERGQALPSFPTLLRLCAVLETTPDALLLPVDAAGNPGMPRVRKRDGDGIAAGDAPPLARTMELLSRLDPADRDAVNVLVEHFAERSALVTAREATLPRKSRR